MTKTKQCETCDGEGGYYVEVPRPQGFHRDIGYIDEKWTECEDCGGSGEVEDDDWYDDDYEGTPV